MARSSTTPPVLKLSLERVRAHWRRKQGLAEPLRTSVEMEEELAVLREPVPASESLAMLAFEDSYLAFHGGPALFTDPKHHARRVPVWGNTKGGTLGDSRYLFMRPLLEGDRLVGFWEYDVDAGAVVFGTFG